MTRTLKPELVANVGARHGEGPLWHPVDRRLDWTDLVAGHLHRTDPATGRDELVDVGMPLGAFAPRAAGGFVLAVEAGFALMDAATGRVDLVATVDHGPGPKARMNDGKCDPQGRFWAGTMAYDATPGRGALYRLDPDLAVTRMVDGVTISNGLDWTDDQRTMYYIDSPTSGVDAFDFDPAGGRISGRRRVVEVPDERRGPARLTLPDGMTLDAEGWLWVAVWGAGEVRRYSPAGELDVVVEMPVALPTSVAFGGDDLDDLYITSMAPDRPGSVPEPLDGTLFRCRPGVRGRPPRTFAG